MNIKQFNNLKEKAKRSNTTLEKVVKGSKARDSYVIINATIDDYYSASDSGETIDDFYIKYVNSYGLIGRKISNKGKYGYGQYRIEGSRKDIQEWLNREHDPENREHNKIIDSVKDLFVQVSVGVKVETAIYPEMKAERSKINKLCKSKHVACTEQLGKNNNEGITLVLSGDKQNIQTIIYQLDDDGMLVNVPRGFELRDSKKDSIKDESALDIADRIGWKCDMVRPGLYKFIPRKLYSDDEMLDIVQKLRDKYGKRVYMKWGESSVFYIKTKSPHSIDSIKDVDPKPNESKQEFLARFMNETKGEYPDEKQRYAVANSYWEKKGKDSIGDAEIEEGTIYRRNGDGAEIWVVDKTSFGRYKVMMRNPESTRGEWTYKNAKDLERIINGLGFKKVKDSIQDSYIIYSPTRKYAMARKREGVYYLNALKSDAGIYGLKYELLSMQGKNGLGEVKISGDRNKLERFAELEFIGEREPQIQDSIKSILGDNAEIVDEDIDNLSEEEKKAIEDYKQAIAGTQDVRLLELYSHILREEIEHLRELNEAKATDSVKDSSFENLLDNLKKYGVKYTEVPNDREYGVAYDIRYNNVAQAETIKDLAGKYGKRILSQSSGRIVVGDSVKDWDGHDIVKLERIDERLRRNDADSWDGYLTGDEKQYIIDLLESKRMTIDKFKQVAPIIYREYGSDLEKHARDSVKDGIDNYWAKNKEVYNLLKQYGLNNYVSLYEGDSRFNTYCFNKLYTSLFLAQ